MSQTKFWNANKGTSVRTGGEGCGGSSTFKVGHHGSDEYAAYVGFAVDWTDVGRIVSATLVTYTDNGTQGSAATIGVRRVTTTFTQGNNVDGVYNSSDYTSPSYTNVNLKHGTISRTAGNQNRTDITAIIEDMAPSTVHKRNGTGGGHGAFTGLRLYGISDLASNAADVWSETAPDPTKRPVIELVYEYGATAPNTPTNLAPSGTVASIGAFQGDFSDRRSTDILAFAEVEVFDAAHSATASAATNIVTSTAHGLHEHDTIQWTALTGAAPVGTFANYEVRDVTVNTFKLTASHLGPVLDITSDGTAMTWSRKVYAPGKLPSSGPEVINARVNQVPNFAPVRNASHRWRMRVYDQEGQVSAWTGLTSFSVTNTNPNAPTLTPASGSTYASLDGIEFRSGTFSDPDAGDTLLAYEVQMSAYASGAPQWDDDSFILWATGKRYVPLGDTTWSTPYGGASLTTGTYYWRARVWDSQQGVSAWTYNSIILSADFIADVSLSTNAIQLRPRAPWRIVIKEMAFDSIGGNLTGVAATNLITSSSAHGLASGRRVRFSSLTGGAGLFVGTDYYVIASGLTGTAFKVSTTLGGTEVDFTTAITAGHTTAIVNRGPGNTVAILEDAMNVGASKMYNSPGELHFTLSPFHPQISVIEPKQTHYAVEFRQGDGWREVFAGLMWDVDATDSDVVFYGIDYLSLLDYVQDTNVKTTNLDADYSVGGSKYSNVPVKTIIASQLQRAKDPTNSPVKFIGITTVPAALSTPMTVYSTYQPTLTFVTGLIDSYRAGTGKRTRLSVNKTGANSYSFVVVDDPGVTRNNLRLRYGELVQGFRVIPFGKNWATRTSAVGRDRIGVNVRYIEQVAPGIDETVWGRFASPQFFDGVADQSDLGRRARQFITAASMLGRQVGLGVRSGVLQPNDGYDLTDKFPVDIEHGAIDTSQYGHNGLWVAAGITWMSKKQGEQATVLTLLPTESGTAPSSDLLVAVPISTQAEWQIGWTPPATSLPFSKYWLDQTTGITYQRVAGTLVKVGITGDV